MVQSIWTIGHSTHPITEFIGLLRAYDIEALADVRRFPGSRKHPQFNQGLLASSLSEVGVVYSHFPELGGRRQSVPDSINTAWRNDSFRGYADYMQTTGFTDGVDRLLQIADSKHTAIMCAEALWWRCHRGLISDYLKAAGIEVIHILSATASEIHPYTSAAHIVSGKLSYTDTDNQPRLF
jgi:uncharacterized protein (DUF488 family)